MNKEEKKIMWITTLVCLLPMILTVIWYDKLPAQVPVHFDGSGNVNGYGSKWSEGFLFPLLMAGLNLLVQNLNVQDPARRNQPKAMKRIVYWIIPVLTVSSVSYCLYLGMGYSMHVINVVQIFTSLIFIIIGNYLPKCKTNRAIGIRLPWIVGNEAVWNKTHRMAGVVWVIGGILMLIVTFIGGKATAISGGICIAVICIPIVYSIFIYRKRSN